MMNQPISNQLKNSFSNSDTPQEESWMISYIDVFILITTLFVMLLFLNRPDMQDSNGPSIPAGQDEIDLIQQINQLPPSSAGKLNDNQNWQNWNRTFQQTLKQERMDSLVKLVEGQDFAELEISSRVLFNSGEAELTRSGEAVLEQLLPLIAQTRGMIFIEGHTDDLPIQTPRYPSNWELASARATEVLKFFVAEGMDDKRFRAVSYGDTKPLLPNSGEANRQKNRRVNLVIHRTPDA